MTPEPDRTLSMRVYWKPTHKDLYLHWDSHCHKKAKYIIKNTLHHRATSISSTPELFRTEKEHLREDLSKVSPLGPGWDGGQEFQTIKH